MKLGEPYIRYIIQRSVSFHWWKHTAEPLLKDKGWLVTDAADFSYESAYGFEPERPMSDDQVVNMKYSLHNASAVLEYRGNPPNDSIFGPSPDSTVIDDLLPFMSLYSGEYWQYLWRERRHSDGNWKGSFALHINHNNNASVWARENDRQEANFFEQALETIAAVNGEQLKLAMQWFFIALREFEIGYSLVEAALNWVALEAQANYLGLEGNDVERVRSMLKNQGFPEITNLGKLYGLRGNAFHEGQLLDLSEKEAKAVLETGRALVRAQILNLLGMQHSDFRQEFVDRYAE